MSSLIEFADGTSYKLAPDGPDSLFWSVALIVGGGGIVALLAAPPVRKLMGDVE